MGVAVSGAVSIVNAGNTPTIIQKNYETYVVGSGPITPPTYYRNTLDFLLKYLAKEPKVLAQTLRYICEWALLFFSHLKEYNPMTRAVYALKQVNTWFNWQEEVRSISNIYNTFSSYLYPSEYNHKPTYSKIFEDLCDLVSKTCELFRWFVESKIFAISEKLATSMLLMNGITMMLTFAPKINAALDEAERSPSSEIGTHLWKAAKYISLFGIGVILTMAYFFGFNYTPILVCTTISLIANYAQGLREFSSCTVSRGEVTAESGEKIQVFVHTKNDGTPHVPDRIPDMIVNVISQRASH